MGACVWSMRPVSAVVVPVPCANNVNGMAALPPSRSLRECAPASARRRFCTPAASRDWSRRYYRRACRQLLHHQCVQVEVGPLTSASLAVKPVPLSRAQRAHYRHTFSRTAGSQCAPQGCWSGDDQTVRCPRRLCHLTRFGDGLTPFRQPLGSLFSDKHACPSGAFWPFFLAVPQFCPFCSPSLTNGASRSARLLLIRSGLSSSTNSLRNSWAYEESSWEKNDMPTKLADIPVNTRVNIRQPFHALKYPLQPRGTLHLPAKEVCLRARLPPSDPFGGKHAAK
jgi:hypothetical protein